MSIRESGSRVFLLAAAVLSLLVAMPAIAQPAGLRTTPARAPGTEATVEITIHADQVTHQISPYIYGTNQEMAFDPGFTATRQGGNRLTGYNWENNYSNAGSDWQHSSDTYLMGLFAPPVSADNPAGVIEAFHETRYPGSYSLITLQLAGYVSADRRGTVSEAETAPSMRWREVRFSGGPASTEPDLDDGVVYIDQLVRHLVAEYGRAAGLPAALFVDGRLDPVAAASYAEENFGPGNPGPILGYSLDNEPALWSSTHPRIFPEPVTVADLLRRSEAVAASVKQIDPGAEVFGPALYGYYAFVALQDAPDWGMVKRQGGYGWFIDAYLDRMRQASERRGVRLLDVLDLHWYPEARGTDRIVFNGSTATTPANVQARLQAPMSLWNPEYREDSWITRDFLHGPIELIPQIRESIDRYYPGTRLAFTEWAYGGEDHISGGLAVADVLGVFGRYDVYLATYWGGGPFAAGGYELYRLPTHPDDAYGSRNLELENPDPYTVSVYASLDETDRTHVVIINKSDLPQVVSLAFARGSAAAVVAAYQLDSSSPRVHAAAVPAGFIPG